MCYGFDPTKGIYTVAIGRMLSGAARSRSSCSACSS